MLAFKKPRKYSDCDNIYCSFQVEMRKILSNENFTWKRVPCGLVTYLLIGFSTRATRNKGNDAQKNSWTLINYAYLLLPDMPLHEGR